MVHLARSDSDGGPPDDQQSFFGGPAWTLDPLSGQYYFHLFDRKQPDLNWENPEMRAEIWAMMNRWFDRGIAGFRMDVIDLIGKDVDAEITADGPKLHDHIREMHGETLAGRDVVTVGEAWSANLDNALLYTGRDRGELSMVFQFAHVTEGWDPAFGKWRARPRDLVGLKRVFNAWQQARLTTAGTACSGQTTTCRAPSRNTATIPQNGGCARPRRWPPCST
ncbi:MAG: alpha-amylase family glycosyl hydrolase [Paracoccaceae bacterium]